MIRKDLDSLEATCRLCLQIKPRQDVDRLLWCEACREAAEALAAHRSWYFGLVVAIVLTLWIWLYIQPTVLIGPWVGTVLGAFYVSARVAREILYTVARTRSLPTAGAVPPEVVPPE